MSVPDPSAVDWVPLWSLGTVASALPADTAIPANTRIISNKLLVTDTQPAWRVMGDGKYEWGLGGTIAPDVNLYRSAVDTLKTDDNFYAVGQIIANQGLANQIILSTSGYLYFGSAIDTYLQRTAASALYTNGTFTAGGRFYSGAASTGGIYVNGAAATQFFGSYDANNAGIYNGAWTWLFRNDGYMSIGGDCYIWRGGAQNLFVGETLRVNTSLVIGQNGAQAYIYFGGALDTTLYRQTAGQLKTASLLLAGSDIYSCHTDARQVVMYSGRGVAEVIFGQPNDCSLYRESAHWINHYSADGAWGGFKAAVYNVQSDRKTKSEIELAEVPVEHLLNTKIYTYKRDKMHGRHLGLMANELPEEITDEGMTPEGETLQFVDLYKLATALLATVQHLDGRLKMLEGSA